MVDEQPPPVIALALAQLQVDLREAHRSARKHEARFGVPPKELVAQQREPSFRHNMIVGKALARWRVGLDSITPVPLDIASPKPEKVGMYWTLGRADIAILPDGNVVIGWSIGPRYGRGFQYTPHPSAAGRLVLGYKLQLWIS